MSHRNFSIKRNRQSVNYYADDWRFFKKKEKPLKLPNLRNNNKFIFSSAPFDENSETDQQVENLPLKFNLSPRFSPSPPKILKPIKFKSPTHKRNPIKFNNRHGSLYMDSDIQKMLENENNVHLLPTFEEYRAKVGGRYVKYLNTEFKKMQELPIAKPMLYNKNELMKNQKKNESSILERIRKNEVKLDKKKSEVYGENAIEMELNDIRKIIIDL